MYHPDGSVARSGQRVGDTNYSGRTFTPLGHTIWGYDWYGSVMKHTPTGTAVGVDDPYAHVERCDHLTNDGRCRFAIERTDVDQSFSAKRAADGYACPVGTDTWDWSDCPHFRSRETDGACIRCGLTERVNAHAPSRRPLIEEHHLSYAKTDDLGHEITVSLCRWCHANVHRSWARITDDVSPDPEAIAERERRRGEELEECAFRSAAERRRDD